jgi:hypothetical protein
MIPKLRIGAYVWIRACDRIAGAQVIADDGGPVVSVQVGYPATGHDVFRSQIHRDWQSANEAEKPVAGKCPLGGGW